MVEFIMPPEESIREKYRIEVEDTNGEGGWPIRLIKVFRGDEYLTEYERRYAMLSTFMPFRQLQEDGWHDYALISPRYTQVSVLDLETLHIYTEQPSPDTIRRAQDLIDEQLAKGNKTYEKYTAEGFASGWGFCPVEFWVPDFWDFNDPEDVEFFPGGKYWETDRREQMHLTGQWALYSGCTWGDDSSWKLQYIDLSRLREGIVTTDDRFGYVILPGTDLKDAIRYHQDVDKLEIAVATMFDRGTGVSLDYGYLNSKKKPTREQDVMWRHLISQHGFSMGYYEADFAALEDLHEHEHDGPGTIRNHPRDDRSYDQKKIKLSLDEE